MSLIIRNLSVSAVEIGDLGLTIAASQDRNLREEPEHQVIESADLLAAITAGDLVFLDQSGTTALNQADSLAVLDNLSPFFVTNPEQIESDLTQVVADLNTHEADTSNPHSTSFVGLTDTPGTAGADNTVPTWVSGSLVNQLPSSAPVMLSTIDGQPTITYIDTTRGSKELSVDSHTLVFSERRLNDNDWIQIGQVTDASAGFPVPRDATITGVSVFSENNPGGKEINLFSDATDRGTVATISAAGTIIDNSLNLDVTKGQKIRLRAGTTGGAANDVVITVSLQWRN